MVIPPIIKKIQIPIVADQITDTTPDVRRIKHAFHVAITRGITKAIKATIKLAEKIVPESKIYEGNPKGYPPSYRSKQLMKSFIAALNQEIVRLQSGSFTLRDQYYVRQIWKASYTKYVNEMTGVKWTKRTTQEHFVEILDLFLKNALNHFIDVELSQLNRGLELLYAVS